VRQRLVHGLEFMASYTYAKGYTNNRGYYGSAGAAAEGAYWQNTYDPDAEFGPAFHDVRRLRVLLDGREVQMLTVAQRLDMNRVEPLRLAPGEHDLMFQPIEPPEIAAVVLNNRDSRALSIMFGTWEWTTDQDVRQ